MASRFKSDHFVRMMRAQERWRLEESVNLLPSENVASPQVRALLASDFGHRYTLPVNAEYAGAFLENSYRGTRITTQVEKDAEAAACEVFSARHACVQPLSGHIAAMIAIVSTTRRGDLICPVPVDAGGYDGYAQEYIPDMLGLRSAALPFDKSVQNLDHEAAAAFIRKKKPRLVLLGASFILFPYDIAPVRDACDDAGSTLAYDGSHVLGLIAGQEFQRPLKEGVDVLYGSTHKSFFGPQGGLIVTDDDELDEAVRKNLTWRVVDNVHWNRVASLGQALLEMGRFGKAYARQVVKNAQRLGKELHESGFPVMFPELGYTRSHQLLMDADRVRAKYGLSINDFSIRMERSNVMIDSVARLGASEVTRMGAKEKDMADLAEIFMSAAEGKNVKREVKTFRDRFSMAYRFR
jgi:glycine hydroxymethyltransferase